MPTEKCSPSDVKELKKILKDLNTESGMAEAMEIIRFLKHNGGSFDIAEFLTISATILRNLNHLGALEDLPNVRWP